MTQTTTHTAHTAHTTTIFNHAMQAARWADEESCQIFGMDEMRAKVATLVKDALADDTIATIVDRLHYTELPDFGHDLYLTSAGHGVGFWDGDWDHLLSQDEIDHLCAFCESQYGPFC